jgi:hypothetical protein
MRLETFLCSSTIILGDIKREAVKMKREPLESHSIEK